MKLIIAIIQDKFVNTLVKNFLDKEVRITKLSSTGGFLKSGNSTFLIGVKESELEATKQIIKDSVKSEIIRDSNNELEVHGAHLFVLDVNENIVL